jgi:uroporphyrin-III C-methyltransferase
MSSRDPINALRPPTVFLVGAGPGSPDLLTLRAVRAIAQAELILCDDLVDPQVLDHAATGCRVLMVGKRGGCPSADQRFIHGVMVREALSGTRVVRLKGGDPFVFGRGGEECDALREAGVAVEVVPGLTAGIAGPAAIGVPVTDRRHAPGVALITGHAREGGVDPDWAALVKSGLTLVIYMGVARCAELVAKLAAAGMAAEMPAAVVSAAHTPQQRHARCTLATLAATVAAERLASPAVLVLGTVAALGADAVVATLSAGGAVAPEPWPAIRAAG